MSSFLPENYILAVEQPLQVTISITDGVFIKQIVIPKAGTYCPQHSHSFSHTSMLAVGSMRIWAGDDLLGDFVAPRPVRIPAGVKHAMLALTDGVVFYCIHAEHNTELEQHEFPHA